MSETNENLTQTASAETTVSEGQASGAESSVSENQGAASQETTGDLILGKFKSVDDLAKSYQELERKQGRTPQQSAKDLGLSQEQSEQGAQQTNRTDARQMAQAAGGDGLVKWLNDRATSVGWTQATVELITHALPQMAQNAANQTLAPVNETVSNLQAQRNADVTESAINTITNKYQDFEDHTNEVGAFLKANPHVKELILSPSTTKEQKMQFLQFAYLAVKDGKGQASVAAAKAAGASDARQREVMKAASVTAGATAGGRGGDADPVEAYKSRLRSGGRTNSTLL
jgi:hypothetical protein